MEQRKGNYVIQAERARAEFIKWDQAEMIRRFCLAHDEQSMQIRFFGEVYSINRLTGEVARLSDGSPAETEAVMTIYDVLCYQKNGAFLSGEWQALANLTVHSNFGSSGRSLYKQEALRYAGKTAELRRVCTALGGVEVTKADVGFRFDAFDFLPVIFQFWDGDDEFGPRINFLFDANTLDYMRFETAWYVAGHLLGLIDRYINGGAQTR